MHEHRLLGVCVAPVVFLELRSGSKLINRLRFEANLLHVNVQYDCPACAVLQSLNLKFVQLKLIFTIERRGFELHEFPYVWAFCQQILQMYFPFLRLS